jgi:hypothetical protein
MPSVGGFLDCLIGPFRESRMGGGLYSDRRGAAAFRRVSRK